MKLAFTNFQKCTFPDKILKINIYKEDKGITTIEAEVSSLDSLLFWIILHNENLLYLEPVELMNKIFDKARDLLEIEKRKYQMLELSVKEEQETPKIFISKRVKIEPDTPVNSYFSQTLKNLISKIFRNPLKRHKKLKYKELNIALNLNISDN